tara:strand:- start:539 stop:850 length:312 start_codon:yes stop_codon:yes gene_type:complete
MKFLYLAQNNIEAEIIKHKLLQLNISCIFSGSNLHMAIGELPLESLYVKIFVEEQKYNEAKQFIDDYKIEQEVDINEYLFCEKCNEEFPKSIDACWKCGFKIN